MGVASHDSKGMQSNLVNLVTLLDIGCWVVCFCWMHRISQRQDAMLRELHEQAHGIEQLSKKEHEILKELHPTVQKIERNVDQVKESTQA